MKNFILKRLLLILFLSVTSIANAAPKLGEWTVTLWNDINNTSFTWNICLQSGGNWYISSAPHTGWKGKWFSKGNDSHLQAIHSSGGSANSFDVTRISDNLLAGYYKNISNVSNTSGYYTASLTFTSGVCSPFRP